MKIQGRLHNWENSFLSSRGRVIIIKNILNSIPLYMLQACISPKNILMKIERLFTKFHQSHNRRNIHWMSWKRMCKPLKAGGIAFRGMNITIKCNLIKNWMHFKNQDSLWVVYLWRKYCSNFFTSQVAPKPSDSFIWCKMLEHREEAELLSFWDVGKGDIDFQNDHWIGDAPIMNYLGLSRGERWNKAVDFWVDGNWVLPEIISLDIYLMKEITDHKLHANQCDRCFIKLKKARNCMIRSEIFTPVPKDSQVNWGRKIWSHLFKLSMYFFNWCLMHDLLPTDDILKLCGIFLPSVCHLCKIDEESLDHLFFNCSFSK